MPGFLGIDHPVIVVRDIEAVRARTIALGFAMTPVTHHPWGTATSIAVFDRCLLEIMSIYDESLIDRSPAGDFRFGRTVRDHLADREGISLLALHSDDGEADVAELARRGIVSQGRIDFGRDIVLPDGRADRTATSLFILDDPELPRLSNFICQQHRRDLIQVPRWMEHENGATGLCQVTICASSADQPRVRRRLAGLYGEHAIEARADGFSAITGNGTFVVCDRAGAEARYGTLPAALAAETEPCCIAIHLRASSLSRVTARLDAAGVARARSGERITVLPAEDYGNVFLVFDADPIA